MEGGLGPLTGNKLAMRLSALIFGGGCIFALAAASSSSTIKAFPVKASHPHGIVYNPAGPLQGLWFDNRTTDDTSSVVEFDTSNGSQKTYLTPTRGSQPGSINIASDHSIWFTESAGNKVATVTLAREIKEYSVPTQHAFPLDITRGPDGAMWFVEEAVGKIGRIAPNGAVKEFVVGDRKSHPTALITGPDKAIWFTEVGTKKIGRLTTAISTGSIFGSRNGGVFIGVMQKDGTGSVTTVSANGNLRQFDLPQKNLMPAEFAQTADGAFWMATDSFSPTASTAQLFNLPLPAVKADQP